METHMKRHIATREDIQKLHDHRKKHGWPKTFDGDRSVRKDGLTIEQVAESIKGLNKSEHEIPDELKPKPPF